MLQKLLTMPQQTQAITLDQIQQIKNTTQTIITDTEHFNMQNSEFGKVIFQREKIIGTITFGSIRLVLMQSQLDESQIGMTEVILQATDIQTKLKQIQKTLKQAQTNITKKYPISKQSILQKTKEALKQAQKLQKNMINIDDIFNQIQQFQQIQKTVQQEITKILDIIKQIKSLPKLEEAQLIVEQNQESFRVIFGDEKLETLQTGIKNIKTIITQLSTQLSALQKAEKAVKSLIKR
jgi:hypothetical protein